MGLVLIGYLVGYAYFCANGLIVIITLKIQKKNDTSGSSSFA